jgi:spore cortex formation protein SpoVR/YcgB (stage V sporulation)
MLNGSIHIHEDEKTEIEVEYKSTFDSPTGREYFILTIETDHGHIRAFLPPSVMDRLEDYIICANDERSAVVDGPDDLKGSIPAEQDPVYRAAMQDAGRGGQLP